MSSKLEHNIQNEIRIWCGQHDLLCFRCNVGKFKIIDSKGNIRHFDTGLPEGFPDLIILANHTIYFCECKTLSGKQHEDQIKFMNIVTSKGYNYFVARSIKDVEEVLYGR